MAESLYPRYTFFPRWQKAPPWVAQIIDTIRSREKELDTATNANRSDIALEVLRPGLEELGFEVESGKTKAAKLFRPVFFGENGVPERQYEIDAYNPHERIAFEIEAGRAWQGNAIYRDIVQMSLLVDVDYAVVAVPVAYRSKTQGRSALNHAYRECGTILEAIYGGRRLELPFTGTVQCPVNHRRWSPEIQRAERCGVVPSDRVAAGSRSASLARSQRNNAGPSPSVFPAARYSAWSRSMMGAAADRSAPMASSEGLRSTV